MAETNKHYDIDSGFFKTFLDPYMKYTSGLYANNESLEQGILNRPADRVHCLPRSWSLSGFRKTRGN